MSVAVCELCKRENPDEEPFKVPWDHIGAELMRSHIREKHPEVELP